MKRCASAQSGGSAACLRPSGTALYPESRVALTNLTRMKKRTSLVLVIAGVALMVFLGYRGYRWAADREQAARLAAKEQASALERETEAKRLARIEAEAHRLSALKAQQDAERAEAELARLRAEQATAESARLAAESAAREAAETQARLARERDLASGEARRLADLREREAAEAAAAREAALRRLADAERLSRERAEREAARLAKLREQRELELEAERSLLTRGILPPDYKRRQHYYQAIEMQNASIEAENVRTKARNESRLSPTP